MGGDVVNITPKLSQDVFLVPILGQPWSPDQLNFLKFCPAVVLNAQLGCVSQMTVKCVSHLQLGFLLVPWYLFLTPEIT